MNSQLTKAPLLELMPGLYRQEFNSSVRIIYKWYAGLGGISHKVGEVFVFILGLFFFAMSLNVIIQYFRIHIAIIQVLIAIPFLLIGLILVYRGLALAFNRSVFVVNSMGLTVHHGPLPFSGTSNLDLKMIEIRSVEWRKVGHTDKSPNDKGYTSTGYTATFDVVVNTNMGKTITVLYGIQAREYAFAIASEVSKYLHK